MKDYCMGDVPPARKSGSGRHAGSATATEALLAARLAGDERRARNSLRTLENQYRLGVCGMPPNAVDAAVTAAARCISSDEVRAEHIDESFADVLVGDSDPSSAVLVEVKAQLTKPGIGDLTQADWIRDTSGWLTWLASADPAFASLTKGHLLLGEPSDLPPNLLWAADLAGAKSNATRTTLGATDQEGLKRLADRKWFVIINRGGTWVGRLSDLRDVAAALNGCAIRHRLKHNQESVVAVQTWVEGDGGVGRVTFTYHVYRDGMGRHKLHATAVRSVVEAL